MVEESAGQGVLDALILLAENLRLLIIGPLAAGLLAFGLAFTLPQSFVSLATLNLTGATNSPLTQVAVAMTSSSVLNKVIEALQLGDEGVEKNDNLRKRLTEQIRVTAGKDGVLRLQVSASSPVQAQALANAVLDAWFKQTIPEGGRRLELELRMAYAQESLNAVRRMRDRLAVAGDLGGARSMAPGEVASLFEMVDELQAKRVEDIVAYTAALCGIPRGVITLGPTLPAEPAVPRRGLMVLVTALITEFFLLLWLFVRQVWRRSMLSPGVAAKQARLLAALGCKT